MTEIIFLFTMAIVGPITAILLVILFWLVGPKWPKS
jgi:hypothetical protein